MTLERFPLAPLEQWVTRNHPDPQRRGIARRPDDQLTPRELIADRLGITPAAVDKIAARGLSARGADHAAIAVGIHPAVIWGPAWDDIDPPDHCTCGTLQALISGRWPHCDRCGAPVPTQDVRDLPHNGAA